MRRPLYPCFLLLLLAACAGGSGTARSDAQSKPDELVTRDLNDAEVERLRELEGLYRQNHDSYALRRNESIEEMPRIGPWLAKAMTRYAVIGYDDLQSRGVPPSAEFFPTGQHDFYRSSRELALLGADGAAAVQHYLLRDKRGAVRKVGTLVLQAFGEEARLDLLESELRVGTLASKRAALDALGSTDADRAVALLRSATQDDDWQVRGTALPAYARALAKREGATESAAFFWDAYRQDPDAFVRRQAIEAIGVLGDARQVRPLVEALEAAVRRNDRREAEAAAEALHVLTRKRFGTKVQAWRAWLGDR